MINKHRKDERCERCEYFEHGEEEWGLCRRYPPSESPHDGEHFNYPVMDFVAWCGEFKLSPEETRYGPSEITLPITTGRRYLLTGEMSKLQITPQVQVDGGWITDVEFFGLGGYVHRRSEKE